MNISSVKVLPVEGDEKLKAFVSIKIDNCLVINDIKVIKGADNYFLSMPAKQTKDGQYRDIVYPLNKETRQNLEKIVLEEYNRVTHRPLQTIKRISNSF
jgi:stage V sporulation protein G